MFLTNGFVACQAIAVILIIKPVERCFYSQKFLLPSRALSLKQKNTME